MKLSMRALAIGSFFATLAAVGVFAYPALAEEGSLDFWNLGDYRARQKTDEEVRREMDRRDDIVMHRVELREETIREIIEGRMSFDEATQRFVLLNRGAAFKSSWLEHNFHGRTESERAALQLISFLSMSRSQAARTLAAEQECILFSRGASTSMGPSAICE